MQPGLVIFVAVEGTFVRFTKGHDHFISNSIRCGCLRQDQCNIACLRSGNELRLLIYAVRVCRLPSLLAIMLLGTLYSKKWYDMPHIGCGIHSLQRSRIGRHSASYNIGMRVVLYKL